VGGKNVIVVTARNDKGWWSLERDGTITIMNKAGGALDEPGALYVLAIGVTHYPKAKPLYEDLNFAGQDAIDFAKIVKTNLGPLYQPTSPLPVVLVEKEDIAKAGDSDVTFKGEPNRNILDEIQVLGRRAQTKDTVVIFLSGHGENYRGNYRFLPAEAEAQQGEIRAGTALEWADIQNGIETIRGRLLLFVDTCHSGDAYNLQLSNQAFHGNILVFTSSQKTELSHETGEPEYGHGAFTQAILEGLEGGRPTGAAKNSDGLVDTKSLYAYLLKRVPELAKNQTPELFRGRNSENFVLAAPQ